MIAAGALLAAITGAGAAAGVVCLVVYAAGSPARSRAGAGSRWSRTLRRWRITPGLAVTAGAAGLVTFAITRWPVAGLAAVPAVIALPRVMSRRSTKARLARLSALESWTRQLADMMAASRGLEDALIHSAQAAPDAVAGPVTGLAARLRTRSMTTKDALRAFADDLSDPVGDLIAAALMLAADRRGPGLHQVLTGLAGSVAKEVSNGREVEAERAYYRSTLRSIVVFTGLFILLMVVNRSYSAPFSTPAGQFVLAIVAGLWVMGLWWLTRLGALAGPQRFLRKDGDPPGKGGVGA